MLLIFILFSLLIIAFSEVSTIPLSIVFLVVSTVLLKKSWVFFAAFVLGLLLDLANLRPLGYTSLIFTILVFLIRLYERKFEIQTMTFVFIATFLGSLVYLGIFKYNEILLQSLVSSFLGILLFKFLWLKLGQRSEIT